jgi:MFS superfamily sulfate permease-like transporter/ketosteroid isomerase-like protein
MNHIKSTFLHWRKDAMAGTITGLMAIPLSVGICLMSEYPVQTGLVTVIAACLISFIMYLFKPGNHNGVPGIAAGLAPVLALGIHIFGMNNMPFLILLTASIQMVIWKFNWQKYILQLVPSYLVEGLLAGIGLKIALKFLPFTYLTFGDHQHANFILDMDHELVMILSIVSFLAFLFLYKKFQKSFPAMPYLVTIVFGIVCTTIMQLPLLEIPEHKVSFIVPLPDFATTTGPLWLKMIGFALMLAIIDVIEQVMSNAAIGKLDALQRPTNTNNSLLTIWISNLVSGFFGGMTNLDGLAKSTTNIVAGAVTKLSNLFTAAVITIFVIFPQLLSYLPEFSLGVIMLFSAWKMIAGLGHIFHHGKYAFVLSLLCGFLVFKLGIFEGLMIALLAHALISFCFLKSENLSMKQIGQIISAKFKGKNHGISLKKANANYPVLLDWAQNINQHNLASIVDQYADDAVLLPTLSDQIRDSREQISHYFQHFFEKEKMSVVLKEVMVKEFGSLRLNMGTYQFSWIEDGEFQAIAARFTFAIQDGKIIEHHSSKLP